MQWNTTSPSTISFVGPNRELLSGETNSFRHYIQASELRFGNGCEHQAHSRINPLAMQLHGHPVYFAGEGFPVGTVNFLFVLQISLAKSKPPRAGRLR